MFSQDDDQHGLMLGFLFGIVALVIVLVVGVGIYQRNNAAAPARATMTANASTSASTTTPLGAAIAGAAPAATQDALDAASIKIENGVVKFYFASGKADLAQGANEALIDVIKGANAGKKLVISGYHDATGSVAVNAEVAKKRAFAVRDALKAAGVNDDKIELKKPEELTASGSNAEARRVEVTVQ